jgi:putative copper resistance protein D
MGLLALVTGSRPQSPARHWPLGFLVLAVFIFLRSSASDGTWPYGETPLLANDAEGLQHRIAAVLALMLGIFEWRTRTATNPGRRAYVFPILAAVGGLLLVTHAHSAFDLKESYLVQVTHVVMGVLALVIGASRWLELRLADRRAGAVAGIAMVLVALVLLFYQEANIDLSS